MKNLPTTQDSAPLLFDRRREDHPWHGPLAELESSGDVARQAVAENWRMDHRVAEALEKELLSFPGFGGAPSGDGWLGAVTDLFLRRICRGALADPPQSACLTWSPANAGSAIRKGTPSGHDQLLHVTSLRRTLSFLSGNVSASAPRARIAFEEITGQAWPGPQPGESREGTGADARIVELGASINELGPEAVSELAHALGHGFGENEPPWWATFAEGVFPLVEKGDGTGLCRALGLGHLEAGDWLLVWRYEISALEEALAGRLSSVLVRPTVVEAANQPWHFPSPPGSGYGTTLHLDPEATRDFYEVLHPPLRGPLARTACTGRLLAVESTPAERAKLPSLRLYRRARIQAQDRDGKAVAWLDRHAKRT